MEQFDTLLTRQRLQTCRKSVCYTCLDGELTII